MKIVDFSIVGVFLISIFACTQNSPLDKDQKNVKDYFDRSINIPPNIERVITLYYVQAELISAIGAKEKIIGIGKIDKNSSLFISTFFPSLLTMPQVGSYNIDYEKIVLLNPNLIFTGTDRPTIERLEQLGYCAIATYPKNLKEITNEINYYGYILGKEKQSQKISNLFDSITNKINAISINIPLNRRPKVYYVRSDFLTTIGGNLLGEIISLAGGQLVTDGVGVNAISLQMSYEDIFKYNPDVIILRDRASVSPKDIYQDIRLKNINAVKNRRIFKEHSGWTEFRLETIFGIIEKAKWLHPDLFKDFDSDLEYKKFIEIVKDNNK